MPSVRSLRKQLDELRQLQQERACLCGDMSVAFDIRSSAGQPKALPSTQTACPVPGHLRRSVTFLIDLTGAVAGQGLGSALQSEDGAAGNPSHELPMSAGQLADSASPLRTTGKDGTPPIRASTALCLMKPSYEAPKALPAPEAPPEALRLSPQGCGPAMGIVDATSPDGLDRLAGAHLALAQACEEKADLMRRLELMQEQADILRAGLPPAAPPGPLPRRGGFTGLELHLGRDMAAPRFNRCCGHSHTHVIRKGECVRCGFPFNPDSPEAGCVCSQWGCACADAGEMPQ